MPTYLNYTTLLADLQNYLERGDQTADPIVFAQIPRLINAAERKLAQNLKILGQIEVLTDAPAGLQVNNPVVSKPDRWRRTVSLSYGTGPDMNSFKLLYERVYEYCIGYWPNPAKTDPNNPPLFYSDVDYQHWYISPTPDQNYPFQAVLYMQPPLLDANNQNNFWSQYAPNALLYGALLEAAPFLKDDPRLQTWGTQWQAEIQSLMAQDLQRVLDRTAERKEA